VTEPQASLEGLRTFFHALRRGNVIAVETAVRADPALVNARDPYSTPLSIAIHRRYRKLIDLLLQSGADPNVAGMEDMRPLRQAIHQKFYEMVPVLVDHGADVNAADPGWVAVTPLMTAISFGSDISLIRYLLDKGADPSLAYNGDNTPLHYAASRNDVAILALLCGRGADWRATNDRGATVLHDASGAAAVRFLLNLGCCVDAKTEFLETPLHYAAKLGRYEAAIELLAAGADPDVVDTHDGCTPLQMAEAACWRHRSMFYNEQLVELLRSRSGLGRGEIKNDGG